jgi:RNA polymerase sigma factor (sigma-70 family)
MMRVQFGAVLRPIGCLFEQGTLVGSSDRQLLERFVAGRDEAAFEALIARHGRSVHAVCWDVLRDPHDAEDAFQATFLILARKAGSLWVDGSLAAWLHRVARRVAVEANRQRARRQTVEMTGLDIDPAQSPAGSAREILAGLLHEEIDRLPEKYRAPIILCDLEELTRDEAAHRLGWPPGTVAGRLARGRGMLRDRLVRRGHAEVDGLMAVAGVRGAITGGVPATWIKKTAQLLASTPAGTTVTSNPASFGGMAIARRVIKAMMLANLRKIAVICVVAGLAPMVLALAVASAPTDATPVETPASAALREGTTAEAATNRSQPPPEKVSISGQIVLPDGTPAKGVRMFFSTRDHAFSHGQIRAEMTVDDQGRFSLDIPSVASPWVGFIGTGTLWAYQPGSLVATVPIYRGALPEDLALRLVIGPPAQALFEVHDPDGKPVAGARIHPGALDRDIAMVPDPLAALIGTDTVTNAHGRAVMTAFFPEEIRSIRVTAEGYGQQEFYFGNRDLNPDPKIVQLRPVGRLKGRLTGDPQAIRRCPLSVTGFNAPGDPVQFSYSRAVTTDDDGRFEVPAMAVGPVGVRTVDRCEFPWFAHCEKGLVDVKAAQTTEVVLSLKRSVLVHGVVRERGTQKPVAGVRMAVAIAETEAMMTAEDGSYQGFMAPGSTLITPRAVPLGYAMPLYSSPQVLVPEDTVEFNLPPFELIRAGEVRGLVVGERARPAIGAVVEASWNLDEARKRTSPHRLTIRTGPDGRFVLPGVPTDAEVEFLADHRGWRTPLPRSVRAGEAVILHLTQSSGVAIAGRVADPAGRPVAGAHVHLRTRRHRGPGVPALGDKLVALEGGTVLIADDFGRFQTRRELDPDSEYAAYATAPGYLTSRTLWIAGHSGSFPVISLRPVRW